MGNKQKSSTNGKNQKPIVEEISKTFFFKTIIGAFLVRICFFGVSAC